MRGLGAATGASLGLMAFLARASRLFTAAAESGNFLEQNAAILPVAPFNVLNNTLLLGWQATQQSFNQNVYGIGWRALGY